MLAQINPSSTPGRGILGRLVNWQDEKTSIGQGGRSQRKPSRRCKKELAHLGPSGAGVSELQCTLGVGSLKNFSVGAWTPKSLDMGLRGYD